MIQVYYEMDQKEASDFFWYSITAGSILPSSPFSTIAAALYTPLIAVWKFLMPTSNTFRGCKAYFSDGTGTTGVNYYANQGCEGDGDGLPGDVCVVVRKETAQFAATGKGRWLFPQPLEADVTGSYLNSGGVTAWTPFAIALKTAVTSGSITLSPAHFSPKLGLLYPIVNTPITSLLATQRRRRGPF